MNKTTETKTAYYGDSEEVDAWVERMINQEVMVCQSCLVDNLLANESVNEFNYEDVENLYPDPTDWDRTECVEWLEDRGDYLEEDTEVEDLQDTIREEADPAEIFEWYCVTTYLASKLDEQGEPLLRVDGLVWWGRTCTGQSIALDPTFYDIYASIQ